MNKIANQQVEQFTSEAKRSMEEGVERMSKGFEDVTQFGQENVEAMVASGKVMAKAAEEMNAEVMAFSKKSYEDSMAAAKEIASSKSVTEFFEKQTGFAKTSFESFVAEATKLNEMYANAAKEAFAPLNAALHRGRGDGQDAPRLTCPGTVMAADAEGGPGPPFSIPAGPPIFALGRRRFGSASHRRHADHPAAIRIVRRLPAQRRTATRGARARARSASSPRRSRRPSGLRSTRCSC